MTKEYEQQLEEAFDRMAKELCEAIDRDIIKQIGQDIQDELNESYDRAMDIL